jgi:hypothetical protein
VKRQNYINPPQNTLVPPSDPHRYSKLSTSSTQMGQTDIGEETSRNQVNETRTIKEKLSPTAAAASQSVSKYFTLLTI